MGARLPEELSYSPNTSTHPIQSGRECMLRTWLVKKLAEFLRESSLPLTLPYEMSPPKSEAGPYSPG